MDDYASNSHKSKKEELKNSEKKEIKKVVKKVAHTKKKSEFKKITESFISEDAGNIKDHVLGDVLIPSIKKALYDIVVDGFSMALWGETGHVKKSKGSRVSYESMYDRGKRDSRGSKRRDAYDYDDIIVDSRQEAEEVLSSMDEIIDRYDMVSVADLYELVGITDTSYTANDYGWFDIRNARAVHVREGWLLKMPKAVPLN